MAFLLEPLKVRSLHLKGRLVMPPMATAKAEPDGMVSRALLDYYDEKSRGGFVSLIVVEHCYVAAEGKASANQLSICSDAAVLGLRRLAQLIHRNASNAALQINHAGSAALKEVIGSTPRAPSAVANPRRGDMPREITLEEIGAAVAAFKEAGRRAKAAGFDAVEIHSAHGYFLNQFLSPLTNQRTDGYGGGISKRIRLHVEVTQAVRSAVGPDFPILMRLGASDYCDGGTTIEESVIAARALEDAGVDIIDVSGGFVGYNPPGIAGPGYFSPLSEAIKRAVSIPVILTGGITEAHSAEELLAAKKADLIGVGRAILKDSAWARRAVESLRPRSGR